MDAESQNIHDEYEVTPYIGGAFAETHPHRLRAVAALAGIEGAPTRSCRVLDIGCGTGRNLIPMAAALPGSTFLGIDLSAEQVAIGQKTVERAGLSNIELRCQDLMDFRPDAESFDYVIAHGVYSWVPRHVRDRLIQICAQSLTGRGVAFVSYNALPGWHFKRVARDVMRYHAGEQTEPAERVARAREALAFAAQASPGSASYKAFLAEAQQAGRQQPDWYLLHDELGAVNGPVYFQDFVRHAASAGLQYLGDAHPTTEDFILLSPPVQEQVRRFAGDAVAREQYLDFLQGREFRASVLARKDADRSTAPTPTGGGEALRHVQKLFVAGNLVAEPGPTAGTTQFGAWSGGSRIVVGTSELIEAFRRVGGAWPHTVSFDDLAAAASQEIREQLALSLLLAYRSGIVELWSEPTDFLALDLNGSRSTCLARLQLALGEPLVNLRHQQVVVTEAIRGVLPLMDGTRSGAQLLRDFAALVEHKAIRLPKADGFIDPTDDLRAVLQQVLAELSSNSLLWRGA